MRAPSPALQRSNGVLRLGFADRSERTIIIDAYQEGSAKVRFPKTRGPLEAVMINLGGGLTDGDKLGLSVNLTAGAHAVLTTQAAEKIYKSRDASAEISGRIDIAQNSILEWLPQETILFDRSNLVRNLTFNLEAGAQLVAVESLVFGRSAYGETVTSACLDDRLRISVGGRVTWYDAWKIDGDVAAALKRQAIAAGCCALASIYVVGNDGERLRDRVRPTLESLPAKAACTCTRGVLAFRLLAPTGQKLRQSVARTLTILRAEIYGHEVELPRVWEC